MPKPCMEILEEFVLAQMQGGVQQTHYKHKHEMQISNSHNDLHIYMIRQQITSAET
jgi:hypothetical protein